MTFSQIQPFLGSLGCPVSFVPIWALGPKNENFQKIKKPPPDIHPSNKYSKFLLDNDLLYLFVNKTNLVFMFFCMTLL